MPTPLGYFFYPFGQDGTTSVIPVNDPGDGSVSYQTGFGLDYQLIQTDINYKAIPRDGFNQLMLDVTTAIQQYQNTGIPPFITTAMNNGSPYTYTLRGINVIYSGAIYQTKSNSVSSIPTVKADWRLMDLNAAGLIIDNVVFEGSVVNGNAVYFNTVSMNYQKAVATGGPANQVIGFADVTNGRILLSGYTLSNIFSGGSVGVPYYLSGTTPGAITTTPPSPFVTPVGTFVTSSVFLVNISNIPLYTALVAKRTQIAAQGFTGSSAVNVVTFNANPIMSPASFISGNGFMMPWNGKYRFSSVMSIFTNQTGTNYGVYLRLNGATLVSILSYAGQGGAQAIQQNMAGSDLLSLSAGNLIELVTIFSGTIGGSSIGGLGIPITSFSVEYLGA